MGYQTDFMGTFEAEPAFTPEQQAYLEAFAGSRRVTWDEDEAEKMDDPVREAVGLPVGPDGVYVVAEADNFFGQMAHKLPAYRSDGNAHAPGYWCQWIASFNGEALQWDGGEKFYEYDAWLVFVVENFCKPWGVTLNGRVQWIGEEPWDQGILEIEDNEVYRHTGNVTFADKVKMELPS